MVCAGRRTAFVAVKQVLQLILGRLDVIDDLSRLLRVHGRIVHGLYGAAKVLQNATPCGTKKGSSCC
jgi:hypothetical protein